MPSTLGVVASGEDVLNDAVLWLDTSLSSVSGGQLTNIGKGGSALNATFGSTTGSDTNDPTLLTRTTMNYLYIPNVANNSASRATAAAIDVTGDLEIIVLAYADDWTPASAQGFAARDNGDPNRAWHFRLDAAGTIALRWFPTGSAASSIVATSTVAPTVSDGQWLWVRATLDVDNGAGGKTATFYTAAHNGTATEPVSWTQLGNPVTTAGTTSIPAVTSSLLIGSGAAGQWGGGIGRVIVRSGIGGTTVFDANFASGITSGDQTTFTESSSSAATVTINRASTGRKSVAVTRNVLLFGTDDYLEVASHPLLDFDASTSMTALVLMRSWATPVNFGRLFDRSSSGSTQGWTLQLKSDRTLFAQIGDGVNVATRSGLSTLPASGTLGTAGLIVNRNAQTLVSFSGSTFSATTSTSLVGSTSTSFVADVGKGANALTFQDFECLAVAVFRRAISANEISTIVARYA